MDYQKRSFPSGWMPDMDSVNGPPDALPRMDNLILDELGVLGLRGGTAPLNTAMADTDVHSLFTIIRSGTKLRYAGAGSAVYRNFASILTGIAGSGDIYFGSHQGQTFMARSTTKRKDDGTTVRNWGIAMTGGTPTINAALASRTKTFADWNLAETALHSIQEDDGTGLTYGQDHAGVADQAAILFCSPVSNRGSITKTFAGDQDFNSYAAGPTAAADDDIFSAWIFVYDTHVVRRVTLLIDVNGGGFMEDYYYTVLEVADETTPAGSGTTAGDAPNDPGNSEAENPPLL